MRASGLLVAAALACACVPADTGDTGDTGVRDTGDTDTADTDTADTDTADTDTADTDTGGDTDTDTGSDTDTADTDTDTGPDTDTDTDTDTGSDTDTGDTDTDTDTDTGDDGSGTYTGTASVVVTEDGFASWTDRCSAPVSIVLDASATSPVTGSAACTFTGDLKPHTITFTFAAASWSATEIAGTVDVAFGAWTPSSGWIAHFDSSGTLDSTFTGSDTAGSAALHWTVTLSAKR